VAKLSRSPKLPRKEGRTISPQQVRLFVSALSGHPHESFYALMLATGLRRGEALGLRWVDYDEESGTLQIRRQLQRLASGLVAVDTKTSTSRRSINLPRGIVGMLETRREQQMEEAIGLSQEWINSGYIFTTKRGTPLDPRRGFIRPSRSDHRLQFPTLLQPYLHCCGVVLVLKALRLRFKTFLPNASTSPRTSLMYNSFSQAPRSRT
jgi:integrase